MGLKDWIAPFITLLIGASTIFISYKNYQAQAAAKPSELARLELWSKLLTEAGMEISALPPADELTSDQRVVLENYRVFLKRASLESKLRKVGIDSNRIFSLLMKRAHSSVKPTPIQMGDSISYYRLILRALLYIWVPLAVIFIGVPIIVVTIAYLIGLFTNHRGDLSDFALSPLAVILLILGAAAVGALVILQNRIISAIIANNVYFYFWDIYGSKKNSRDSAHAYSERLAAKTYADQLFLGQQEFAHQFRENMYMAGIQEIDEYPRVLSDSVMLPRNYRVVETTEAEDRIDRFVNWVRSKIGFERLEPRIIYTLEHKDAHKDEQKDSAHGEPVATEQGVSGQPVETPAQDQQEDAQKAPEAPASEEPIVAEVPVGAPAEDPADAPTEPVTGDATESSAVSGVSAAFGEDDPTEVFNPITQNAAIGEKADGEKPKN
ncbi:MAG: CoA-disulfide reductase [Rothia mucilaginosa]|uniref:CoA-disulfide reductase n=1 Tax=Rothia mucilaginosa TaxID=43675 RepID=UPI0026F29550|nr:CoA-disulfide reductase [Rothia mucilaginosa]MBS5101825.1 CoA-disulfide reductase [Rothia mucilaginosa]